jgi:hypothetical protein
MSLRPSCAACVEDDHDLCPAGDCPCFCEPLNGPRCGRHHAEAGLDYLGTCLMGENHEGPCVFDGPISGSVISVTVTPVDPNKPQLPPPDDDDPIEEGADLVALAQPGVWTIPTEDAAGTMLPERNAFGKAELAETLIPNASPEDVDALYDYAVAKGKEVGREGGILDYDRAVENLRGILAKAGTTTETRAFLATVAWHASCSVVEAAPVCPECRDGKHGNCIGYALNTATDVVGDCECPHD